MTLEPYYASESLCSQKVKLVLAEKELKWKSHLINLLTFENLQPSYMRLNPKGVVPTLLHEGRIITDSVAIMRYLDKQFPYPLQSCCLSCLLALRSPFRSSLLTIHHWFQTWVTHPYRHLRQDRPFNFLATTSSSLCITRRLIAQVAASFDKCISIALP